MSTFPDRIPTPPDKAHGYDPPEPLDDAPVEPFDASNEQHELCLCEENVDA